MGDRIARIVIFGGMLLFGLRGLLAGQTLLTTALICLAVATTAEFFYTSCILRNECLIGEIAKRQGWLTNDHIRHVLMAQEREGGMFGEVAVRYSYLSIRQVDLLVLEQESISS